MWKGWFTVCAVDWSKSKQGQEVQSTSFLDLFFGIGSIIHSNRAFLFEVITKTITIVFHFKMHPSPSIGILSKPVSLCFCFHHFLPRQVKHLYPSDVMRQSDLQWLCLGGVLESVGVVNQNSLCHLGSLLFSLKKKQLCWQPSSTKYNMSFILNYPWNVN